MKTFLRFLFFFCCFLLSQQYIYADSTASPIAVLKSERNQLTYADQHIGDFEEDWKSFKYNFETANVRYDLLSDSSLSNLSNGISKYKVIVIPMLVDLPKTSLEALKEFVKQGGKIFITDGCGNFSENAKELILITGAAVSGHASMQSGEKLLWQRSPFPLEQNFSVGTLIASIDPQRSQGIVANWYDQLGKDMGIAITNNGGNVFLSWCPGTQGELSVNAQLISMLLEESSPGITQKAAVQISFADYQTIKQELEYLAKRTDEVIKTAKQADIAVSFADIQANCDAARKHVDNFETAYKERRFFEADREIQEARHEFALAFAKSMPVRPVESRSVWLDRGTIIACKNDDGMRKLINRLKSANINSIYFETNNSGFTTFPSKFAVHNPQLDGWDAFGTALDEAHKLGMEFHAWLWIYNVGNERHNPIIGKEIDYPGPILAKNNFNLALASQSGSFFAHNQHEYWLDPSIRITQNYIKNLLTEICQKYPVDGIQYDYIRYPFNMKPNEMGWNWEGRLKFERETGLSLDHMDEDTREVWKAWRIAQVNNLVKDATSAMRKIRPNMRISAAVYGFPRRLRCNNIQQDWETWVQSGWIDTVNPMTYKETAKEFQILANDCREASGDKALVFPGISIRQLDTAGFVEQLDTARAIGSLGNTLFAVAQLDDKKLELLKIGPYRKQALMTPQADPIKATSLLVDDFVATVDRYMQDPNKRVIADTASTNEVIKLITEVKEEAHALEKSQQIELSSISKLKENITKLHHLVKEWLRIDAFAQRGFRAQYIISYLSQIESLLSYSEHKVSTGIKLVADHKSDIETKNLAN